MVEIESKIEDGTRHRTVVDDDTGFVEMPSSRSAQGLTLMLTNWKTRVYLTIKTAGFSVSLYDFPPTSKSIFRATASRKLTSPLIMLAKVGALESLDAQMS